MGSSVRRFAAIVALVATVLGLGTSGANGDEQPAALPEGESTRILVIGGTVDLGGTAASDALIVATAGPATAANLNAPLAATRADGDGSYIMFVRAVQGIPLVISAMLKDPLDGAAEPVNLTQKVLSNPVSRAAGRVMVRSIDFHLASDPAVSSADPPSPTPSPTPSPNPTVRPTADLGAPPSGEVPILFNDRHVYVKPDRIKANRVLAALVRGNTILIPLRSMFEQLGATVSYDPASKTVDVSKPGADVKVTVGRPEVVINGESRPLDVPPEIYKGAVVVPVRVIAEGMGAYVQWVPDRRIVVVRFIAATPPPPPPPPPLTPPPLATPAATGTPAPSASPRATILVYFATNRNHVASVLHRNDYGETLGQVSYGTAPVAMPKEFTPQIVQGPVPVITALLKTYWTDVSVGNITDPDYDGTPTLQSLKSATKKGKHVLLLVHGFNVGFTDGLKAAAVLKKITNYDGNVMLFSWPAKKLNVKDLHSLGASLNPVDLFVRKTYDANVAMVGRSGQDLAGVLKRLANDSDLRIDILAHSMGNQVLLAALDEIHEHGTYTEKQRYHKAWIAMVAADVAQKTFCARYLALRDFTHFANVVDFRDAALDISDYLNNGLRLGQGANLSLLLPSRDNFTLDASRSVANAPWHGYLWDNASLATTVIHLYRGSVDLSNADATAIPGYFIFRGPDKPVALPNPVPDGSRCPPTM